MTVGGASQKTEIQSQPATSSSKHGLLLGLILLIATLALYYPVGGHPFVNYDDGLYVTQNLQVQSGLNWDTVVWSFRTFDVGTWHPLTWLSHALDCQLFQLEPRGHHDVNLLLHAANVVLLFWVLLRATGYAGRSFMVAALFALHPINVESVAWMAERKNLAQHAVFSAGPGRVPLVCAEPAPGPLCGGRGPVCAGPDGQAAGDYFPVCAAAVGLLAIAAHVR